MTAISINKHIYNILSNDSTIKEYVGNKIFPMIAEESTTFPFIIYRKNTIQTEYTKDGRVFDIADISITVVANDYITTVNVAERIRELIEWNKEFADARMISNTDEYIDNAYVQEITFSIKIRN